MTPDRILRDLHGLWLGLGKESPNENGHGVLRACTMTLYVLADESDDPSAIWELLAAIMPGHPSRAILVRLRRGQERAVDARVFAQCWLPFGQRQQICCEQIEITATDASLPDLPPFVGPLAAADLPVVLYCRCPRLFASPELAALAGTSGKLIVDSALYGDVPAALAMLAARPETPAVADLAWTRLTPWRAAVAEIFDAPALRERLAAAAELRVEGAFSTEACYLAAWLSDGVSRAGGSANSAVHSYTAAPPAPIHGLALSGAGLDVAVTVDAGGFAEIRVGGAVRRTSLPRPAPHAALGEELGLTGPDPVYRRILPVASRLAISSST